MTASINLASPVELRLVEKLRDVEFRHGFFLSEMSLSVAKQIIAMRKLRGISQWQLAELTGTKQPAISRHERADPRHNLLTLCKISKALDARIRIIIEPSEDILGEYDDAC